MCAVAKEGVNPEELHVDSFWGTTTISRVRVDLNVSATVFATMV